MSLYRYIINTYLLKRLLQLIYISGTNAAQKSHMESSLRSPSLIPEVGLPPLYIVQGETGGLLVLNLHVKTWLAKLFGDK